MFCEGRADCGDRHCPGHPVNSDEELTRRQQEAELRWQCRDQMSARQLYEHARAGDFGVGDESANPALVTPPREAMPVQLVGKEPTDWSAITRWGAAVALCVLWTVLVIYAR
jgi:hypothetical protein